jgi:hypothetical protein
MPDVDRIPVLVYDDGTPTGAIAMDRALTVAARVVLATAHRSPNQTRNIAAADHADIPLDVVELAAATGIRHALALCADPDIFVAYIPRPAEHTGEQLRKIIQAAALNETDGLPVLAVHIVHPDAALNGPVVEIDPAHTDAGFAALFAAGLAGSTGRPLHIVRLAGDSTNADTRAADALHQARQLIADSDIPVYDQATDTDPIDTALSHANGASAVVIGLGGFTARGRKLMAPDELPDNVLHSPDGELAHELARHATTDLVIVLDAIDLQHGYLAQTAVLAAAVGAITAGTLTAGAIGLAATVAAVGTAAGYTVLRDRD